MLVAVAELVALATEEVLTEVVVVVCSAEAIGVGVDQEKAWKL